MRRAITTLAAAALAVATASTALAGGWAVTSVDSMPDRFEAESTHTIEYTVLAHGKTPVDAGASHVMVRNSKAGESLRFGAVYLGDGRYRVEMTLPVEGTWQWEVTHAYGPQSLGAIEVAAAGTAPAGFDVNEALKVVLPLATLIAAAFTVREWSRGRAAAPTTETG
jgi:hypothetical protein